MTFAEDVDSDAPESEQDLDRLAFCAWVGESWPEVRRVCDGQLDPVGEALARWLGRLLGEMTQAECAALLGVTRQQVNSVEQRAKRKVRLAGGARLREAWEGGE